MEAVLCLNLRDYLLVILWVREFRHAPNLTFLQDFMLDDLKVTLLSLRDVIANRKVTTVSILFRLHVLFQPGGGAERTTLLKCLTEVKTSNNIQDLLVTTRTWRRWLQRAEELRLTLPDPLILMQVLGRIMDSLSKLGGSQVAYRVSSVRQELLVDLRPELQSIKDLSEYLQAEMEDLSLMIELEDRGEVALSEEDRQWWQKHFPELPHPVLQHMAGQSQDPTTTPWNRRIRRAHLTGKGVIVHLFSGPDVKKWNCVGGGAYSWLCIDTEINSSLNLRNPAVWGYLWKLASLGRIVAIVGGPPCRTVSRLRNRSPPGPRRLRGRGEDRWCLNDLSEEELRLVHGDTALCMKHMGLWIRAQECRRTSTNVGMLLESPRDPAEYLAGEEGGQSASFWCFPELMAWVGTAGLRLVTFDQGKLGDGCDDRPLPSNLGDRIRTSKTWAAWAPGLVGAIQEALRRLLGVLEEEKGAGGGHHVSKMDLAAWHRHIKQGHIPFRADCRICGEAMGCDKPHKRLGGSATKFTMSADLCGPFPEGKDLGTGVICKYALVSTVAVPIISELPGEVTEPCDTAKDVEHTEEIPCEPEDRDLVPEDEVRRLNEMAEIEKSQEPQGHQNVTLAEVIPDRTVESLVRQLSTPYRTMQLLGPFPYMSHGWIVRDKKGQLLHVRTALEPSPVADQAIMELQEVPAVKHRIAGKHPPPLPDHPLAGRVGALYEESVPALATCRAGGEDSLDSLDWSSSLDVGKSLSVRLEPQGELEEVNGGHKLHDKVEPGDELLHRDLQGEVEDPLLCDWQQVEKWHELEQQRHWALKQLWCQGLREVAVGENSGSVHGSWLHEVELLLKGAEDQLSFQHSAIENFKLSALAPSMGTPDAPATVLQTYTVSLQQVRRELEKWKPPLRDEYGQLVSSTQAIKPTTEEKLRLDPRFPTMELAPAMLVPTVKSPHGRLRARVVICGNHLTKVNEESNNSAGETQPKDSNPFSLYAGGADGTTLRCLMKCAAENSWSVGTVDVKTAFLLAPRPDEQERLLVARPPKVLIEAGICDAAELWEISHAVYGLNDAPANWSQYRDRELPQLRFSAGGHDYQLVSTPEPNLWKLIKTDPGALPQEDNSEGFLAVYVDDMLVAAPGPLAKSVIDGIRAHWRCSEPEWATAEKAIKFCGFEISCSDDAVILNQASYTRDLLSRHEGIKPRQTPLPLGVQDEVEADVQISQVRRAQALVGELLWLSGRTRPDLCYGVSIMGRLVTKAPTKVLEWGAHMLGYLQHTVDYELRYTKQVVESCIAVQVKLDGYSGRHHWHGGMEPFAGKSQGPPPVDDTLEPPQRRATLDSVAENSTGTPSSEQVEFPTANVTWVRTEVHSVRRTSSSSSSAPSQTSPSTRSSATGSTAAARGSDAIDAGVTLGYMGRLGGYLSRGENLRSGPASSATESESEREDWRRNLDVSSTSSVQGHETTLPPGLPPLHEHLDEVPQWMGIVSQLPVRPRGVPGQSDHLRDPDSDSDGSYEVCG
ncbi:unnamed protein product [Durusdinium trenchii]|uniref:Reverse transcriptase Ty1/copia-type domain-containing protein n=1 Tax=Durusdinium trenchii TaxID=1381693 RepID=A0ABP0MZL7_9DINO